MALAPRNPRRKRLVIAGIALAVISAAVIAAPWVQRWASATVSVPFERIRIATVTRGNLVRDVTVQGRVVAAVSPTLYATTSGTITLLVESGAEVAEGDPVAVLDLRLESQGLPERRRRLVRRLHRELEHVAAVPAGQRAAAVGRVQRVEPDAAIQPRGESGGHVGDTVLDQEFYTRYHFKRIPTLNKYRYTATANMEKFDPATWDADVKGVGFGEAPRGSLGHWIHIKDTKIENYQAIVPTTWNASPRDPAGNIGAYEASLLDTPMVNPEQPLEILRTIHSFDPCIACAVHLYDEHGKHLSQVQNVSSCDI